MMNCSALEPSFKKPITAKGVIVPIVKYLVLALFSVIFLFPFIIMICYSVLPNNEALTQVLISKKGIINLGTYVSIFTNSLYIRYFLNTMLVSTLASVGTAVSSALCAYGFSKLNFTGKNVAFAVVLGTMMLPAIAIQIPLYTVYSKIGWSNTILPLWVPACFGGGAINIFLMTQFMKGIPNDISNAAKIDGASAFRIFYKILVPLCIPVFLFVLVSAFMASWNDFATPLLFIRKREMYTLALGIYKDYGGAISSSNLPNMSMAAGIVMMVPCMILFFVFQKYLIEGVAVTGLKG